MGELRARLVEYRKRRELGAPENALSRLANAIMASAHPTVWREMQRQRVQIDEMGTLFRDVPEALDW